jgi:hypothetical protein
MILQPLKKIHALKRVGMGILRSGALTALTVIFASGLGSRASALQVIPGPYVNFNFSFGGSLVGGGSVSGYGTLNTQETTPTSGEYNIYNVSNGVLIYSPSPTSYVSAGTYSLSLAPLGSFNTNDNVLFVPGNPNFLDSYGVSFIVGPNLGYLNIADGNYNFATNFGDGGADTGSGGFNAPGPVPGAGLASLAFLILAAAATKARGFLAR